jgi:hypothetical protein
MTQNKGAHKMNNQKKDKTSRPVNTTENGKSKAFSPRSKSELDITNSKHAKMRHPKSAKGL